MGIRASQSGAQGIGGEGGGRFDAQPYGGGGTAYGASSAHQPTALGSGGGLGGTALAVGGAGGGAVKLAAGRTLTVNGTIIADGYRPDANGGAVGGSGSGGSIWLIASNFTGAATALIRARGADARQGWGQPINDYGGPGGGGRIACTYETSSFAGSLRSDGGNGANNGTFTTGTGGAGTIYTQEDTEGAVLLVDNFRESAMYGTAGTWVDNSILNTCDLITVRRYGILKHAADSAAGLTATVDEVMIESYGAINVSDRGRPGGVRPSHPDGYGTGGGDVGGIGGGGGGGGGEGGSRNDSTHITFGGPSYDADAVMAPTALGSGGGAGGTDLAVGGAGGGAVVLNVTTLTVDGTILADGERPFANGGAIGGSGSGGSIWIRAATFAGAASGLIRARGGDGRLGWGQSPNNYGGPGGGGRVAIQYTAKTYQGLVRAEGGTGGTGAYTMGTGAAGTIYEQRGTDNGTLLIDNLRTSMSGPAGALVDNSIFESCDTVIIQNAGVLTHANDSSAGINAAVRTFTIGAYGYINVSSRGRPGGLYPSHPNGYGTGGGGGSTCGRGAGGGYGGKGGHSLNSGGGTCCVGGTTYGSETEPTHLGSGGGSGSTSLGMAARAAAP